MLKWEWRYGKSYKEYMNDQIFMKSSVSPSIEQVFLVISDMQSSLSGGKMDGKLFYAFFIILRIYSLTLYVWLLKEYIKETSL